jgi:hypothetical protein
MKKYDWLMFYDAIEYCEKGYTLKEYCIKNNFNYRNFLKAINRAGIIIIRGKYS